MTQAGQVQYACPSLCTDPSMALGVVFESELSSRVGSALRSRGCLMLPLALCTLRRLAHFRDSYVPRHVPGLALGISGFADEAPGLQTHFVSSSENHISKGAGISQKH
ncbi:LOW QUALITY PROTEIN: hypothetical protein Nmel_013984 [Mimus melanotis]